MWRRNVQSPQLKCVICALVVVCCLDACLSLLLCLFLVALPAWQSVCFELWSCYPKYRPPLRDVFIPAVSLSCWRLTLHPSVLPSIPPSLHPPILVWSFVPQQRGKASDNKQPCVCVCVCLQSHWLHGKNKISVFRAHLHFPSHFSVCACVFTVMLWRKPHVVYSGTFYPGYEASVLRTLSLATLTLCALHSTHTHTWSSTVDSLLLCQGISHDQSQSFVSPGVKKVKTERRRRLEGNIVRFRAYTLFMAEQRCATPELLQKKKKSKNIVILPPVPTVSISLNQCMWTGFAWEYKAMIS